MIGTILITVLCSRRYSVVLSNSKVYFSRFLFCHFVACWEGFVATRLVAPVAAHLSPLSTVFPLLFIIFIPNFLIFSSTLNSFRYQQLHVQNK